MIALCLAALALVASKTSVTPIAVAVVAPHDVTESLVNRICAEAAAIWAPAGIALEWTRNAVMDETRRLVIEVTIDDRPAPAGRDGALGWLIFTDDGPDRFIHLSRASAESLLRSRPGPADPTIAEHEASIGRALGRALAHELGHYVLRSKVHTQSGLMRAVWASDQIFALFREGFGLTSREQATAADNVRRELECCVGAPRVSSW